MHFGPTWSIPGESTIYPQKEKHVAPIRSIEGVKELLHKIELTKKINPAIRDVDPFGFGVIPPPAVQPTPQATPTPSPVAKPAPKPVAKPVPNNDDWDDGGDGDGDGDGD